MDSLFLNSAHRRWNPLKRDWVLVSPHRTQRPWQGQVETASAAPSLAYDPNCYLCPGNVRANGDRTPEYTGTYVFRNDFAALTSRANAAEMDTNGLRLQVAETERGECCVICFSPQHDLTLASMELPAINNVVETWIEQAAELGARPEINYVQIFENRGAMMGASNPHPHGQIWATEHLPNEPALELFAQQEYVATHGHDLLSDYLALELEQMERVVEQNTTWVALVPFWAVWPFELLILTKRRVADLAELSSKERVGLAEILQKVTRGYNKLFDTPFPYSMGLHPAPCDGKPHAEWHLHLHFYPPLLRSATIRKFMVGFELLGSPQRDLTPETAAQMLRSAML